MLQPANMMEQTRIYPLGKQETAKKEFFDRSWKLNDIEALK